MASAYCGRSCWRLTVETWAIGVHGVDNAEHTVLLELLNVPCHLLIAAENSCAGLLVHPDRIQVILRKG